MQSTLIKICGITKLSDAMAAVDAGADLLGLIFVESSPRSITVEVAQALIPAIRKHAEHVKIVGVFQNQPSLQIMEIAQKLQLDYIQLHGQESIETSASLPYPVIKTIVISTDMTEVAILEQLQQYQPSEASNIAALLLDIPKQADAVNMTVRPLPASVVAALQQIPHFLAGGFHPENIHQVCTMYQPHGVDVASGVELSPGRKCPEKMQSFCKAVQTSTRPSKQNSIVIGDSPVCNP